MHALAIVHLVAQPEHLHPQPSTCSLHLEVRCQSSQAVLQLPRLAVVQPYQTNSPRALPSPPCSMRMCRCCHVSSCIDCLMEARLPCNHICARTLISLPHQRCNALAFPISAATLRCLGAANRPQGRSSECAGQRAPCRHDTHLCPPSTRIIRLRNDICEQIFITYKLRCVSIRIHACPRSCFHVCACLPAACPSWQRCAGCGQVQQARGPTAQERDLHQVLDGAAGEASLSLSPSICTVGTQAAHCCGLVQSNALTHTPARSLMRVCTHEHGSRYAFACARG